ncbi:hypothetical protein FRC06_005655 [Ceratobasidium sp. 370]|nr:hypothetical protein FRC06_005655 [Ceratobasidium sp. 370]
MLRFSQCAPGLAIRRLHTTPAPCAKRPKIKDPNRPKPVLTAKELELNTKRRVQKAERDERMDISMTLTEVKTYQGGFTKPRMLRASNWFPGGEYIRKQKVYERPASDAYSPHTVYILESRYPIRTKEPGRPDVPEHLVSMCREEHFTSVVKWKNSPKTQGSAKVSMDAAWWPFLPRRIRKEEQEVWWKDDEDPKQIRLEALGVTEDWEQTTPEPLRDYFPNPNRYRANGTKIVEPTPTKTIHPHRKVKTIGEIRELYEPTLEHAPFWRPLISITVATRPLAATLLRLCLAHPRGLPFYASIDTHDRKSHRSFPGRMRLMRLQRIRHLTIELAKRLVGYQGGFIGIRFNEADRGRGIMGERLAEPLPDPLRIVRVGLCQWYEHEKERELWEGAAADAEVDIEILSMDDWGRKLDAAGNVLAGQEVVEGAAIWGPEEDEENSEESQELREESEGETMDGNLDNVVTVGPEESSQVEAISRGEKRESSMIG